MKIKHLVAVACLLSFSTAVTIAITKPEKNKKYSDLVLANIEALTDGETDPFENDDCTGICTSRLCVSMTGEKGAYEVHSIYHYKRTSYVMVCHHYKICDCPLGQFAIGPVIPSQDCPSDS